jgi:transposase
MVRRGADGMQESLFTMAKLEDFVPKDHPLRAIQVVVNEALGPLNGLFNEIYADTGRASIAPEKLMRAAAAGVLLGQERAPDLRAAAL